MSDATATSPVPATGTAGPGGEPAERFLPALSVLFPAVASAVPQIMQMFRSQRRDFDVPDEVTNSEAARDLGDFLSAILPTVVNLVPTIVEQIEAQSRDLPDVDVTRDPVAYDRFLGGLLSVVVPALVEQLPSIVGQITGNREVRLQDREVSERWLLPALMTVVPALAQNMPSIIKAVSGR